MVRLIYILSFILISSVTARAQGYVDQTAIIPVVESQFGDIDHVEKAQWTVYEYGDHIPKNGKGAWSEFLDYVDSLPGFHNGNRRYIVEMANRITGDNLRAGKKLLVPTTFPEDYRAYSPYPFSYEAADSLPKLFIIDKYTQTFGAYEHGKLVRWGVISTGRTDNLTPNGRFNFNWKAEYRESSAAPPGEVWKMYWMFNIHATIGIHVHQYSLPIAYPASHGCIRMTESDAKWNFNWANGWQKGEDGKLKRNGTPVIVINHNPVYRPAHWEWTGDRAVSLVHLPTDLQSLPAGTYAQRAAKWDSGW